ncbi:hypothetical protein J2S13_002267 [Oikeobacillus pervagus]|uniref:ATP-grasp domain-containing protein n=1 Tax=Oikeobacillus pervagus TaxID=1325931 RepID=A0AAJ1T286_9BACI|nr:YheC/YheD family protein [Oikeobacillus pervagus]MDQ0215847.1 hypothetical protein [Oikeobacillus pervagus]
MNQYQILSSDPYICHHLVETNLFSKSSLFSCLQKYTSVTLKPAFGKGDITIHAVKDHFQIIAPHDDTMVRNKELLYQYLIQNKLKQKYYIIQPSSSCQTFGKSPHHYYMTVHRNTPETKWNYLFKTKKNHHNDPISQKVLQQMNELVIQVATKLGKAFSKCNTIVIEIIVDSNDHIWISDSILHFPISKWSQYHTLSTNQSLAPYIPKTDLLTKETMKEFLKEFHQIIIKPCVGQHGKGIIEITRKDQRNYEIHFERRKFSNPSFEATYHYIKETYLSQKYYIIQQKLHLTSIQGCPIDIRVITQKNESSWEVTGKLVKVAARGYFITNAAQKLIPLAEALATHSISQAEIEQLESEIKHISLLAATQLEAGKPHIQIIGFDIGLTDRKKIWIIEGNYIPDISMFFQLKDKTIYWKIIKGA